MFYHLEKSAWPRWLKSQTSPYFQLVIGWIAYNLQSPLCKIFSLITLFVFFFWICQFLFYAYLLIINFSFVSILITWTVLGLSRNMVFLNFKHLFQDSRKHFEFSCCLGCWWFYIIWLLCVSRGSCTETHWINFDDLRCTIILLRFESSYINHPEMLLHSFKASIFWIAFWRIEKVAVQVSHVYFSPTYFYFIKVSSNLALICGFVGVYIWWIFVL